MKTVWKTIKEIINVKTNNPSKHLSWWRRLEDVLKTSFVFVFRRRLDNVFKKSYQDEYIHLTHTSSEDVFKTFSRRLDQDQHIRLGHTCSRRLQDVFKTSSRRLVKTSSKRLVKTSSRHLQDVLQRCLQDLFKTYHRVNLFLLTRFQDVFETFSKRF